jgi:hypothetical protein
MNCQSRLQGRKRFQKKAAGFLVAFCLLAWLLEAAPDTIIGI